MEILLVDDHALFRDGLSLVIEKIDNLVRVFQAEDAPSACVLAEKNCDLDLVLLDYNIPGNVHFDTLSALKGLLPATPVIILSAEEDAELIQEGLHLGASGFVTKSSSSQVMLSAIQLVLAGGLYVPPAILNKKPANTNNEKINADENVTEISLTDRQKEVLFYLDKGMSNKEIAKYLDMSPSTVKVHVAAILRECHAANRTQAVSTARQNGIIPEVEQLSKPKGDI